MNEIVSIDEKIGKKLSLREFSIAFKGNIFRIKTNNKVE